MSLLLANTTQSTVDGAFVAGIVAGVPEEVHESAIGLLGALKVLVSSDDVLGTVAQSVKQGWLGRIARMEAHYQQADAGRAFNSGREAGSLAGVVRGKIFGKNSAAYPAGISFSIDQKNHLAKLVDFTQKKGIKGAHNADAFNQAVSSNGVKIISRTSGSVNGITHIKYQIPAKDKAGNTVGYKAEILENVNARTASSSKWLSICQKFWS